MAWDSSRPVPWNRLIREWLIYAAIMTAVFVVFFRGDNVLGAIAGVLISGPLYLAFGAAMAKFGYQRTRLKDVRSAAKNSGGASPTTSGTRSDDAPRPKPAPTSRTAGGGSRPKSSSRRKR
ncbi:MAG: hypothetical protein ACM3MM_09035 [Acidobacteriota bacterium]